LRSGISNIGAKLLPLGYRGRNWLHKQSFDFEKGLPISSLIFDHASRAQLEKVNEDSACDVDKLFADMLPRNSDLVQRATRMDFSYYLADDILVKVDRASMANSLEVRSPYLDTNLLNFAFGNIPSECKVNQRERKILLKKLARKVLPSGFNVDRKQGLSIPLNSWLKERTVKNFFKDILLSNDSPWFDRKLVEDMFLGIDKNYAIGNRLYALAVFELWRAEYRISL
jgi:asparagine synthase (glutamine-hydrolysing)